MGRYVVTVVAVVAVGLLIWTAWRVHDLAQDVDRMAATVEAPTPASADVPRAAGVAPAPPSLAAPTPASPAAGDPARVAALETEVAGLRERLADLERTGEELKEVLAGLATARMRANETAAIATARNSISAAAQIQASARCDVDQDGTGEYAGFLEMSGATAGRMSRPLVPPVLATAFRELTANGEVARSGYLYRIFLPDARGRGVGEPASGFHATLVDPDLAETTWCLYAWPQEYGKTGTRTYFTNQGGDVMWTESRAYSGTGSGPASDAAFKEPGTITGSVAFGTGVDGNAWKQAN